MTAIRGCLVQTIIDAEHVAGFIFTSHLTVHS